MLLLAPSTNHPAKLGHKMGVAKKAAKLNSQKGFEKRKDTKIQQMQKCCFCGETEFEN